MRILIDTNVALTYVSGREDPFSNEVDIIMRKCANEEIEGAIALHSLTHYRPFGMRRGNSRKIREEIGLDRFVNCLL